jgi:ABC-type Mn2+/Zn2+ transport system ATPase subunit
MRFVAQDRHRGVRGKPRAVSRSGRDRDPLRPGRGASDRDGSRRFTRNRPLLARPALAADRPHLPRRHPRALLVQLSARRLSRCRGFGRIIDIDYRLAMPDHSLSIDAGAIKCWESEVYGDSKKDLIVFARRQRKIPTTSRSPRSPPEQQFLRHRRRTRLRRGERQDLAEGLVRSEGLLPLAGEEHLQDARARLPLALPGLQSLPRLPAATACNPRRSAGNGRAAPCPNSTNCRSPTCCAPRRLRRRPTRGATAGRRRRRRHSASLAYEAILTRLRYLEQVGLGYLTLDRPSKTLSGGEVQRVNLTSCLGTSLVDTLFVLDEPSVGLHPRDIDRLIAIIRTLTDAGNTVVVVEHDEAMIRAADHVLEVGPEPGRRGGHRVSRQRCRPCSPPRQHHRRLPFRPRTIPVPAKRRPVARVPPRGSRSGATKHNVRQLDLRAPVAAARLPQRRLRFGEVHLAGPRHPPGSAHPAPPADRGRRDDRGDLLSARRFPTSCWSISRPSRARRAPIPPSTPRRGTSFGTSSPTCRKRGNAGFNASSFSFNSGDGRCDHCQGLGYERVEMQFLSDVFVPCPVCEGRFKPEVLAIVWNGRSVADLLAASVSRRPAVLRRSSRRSKSPALQSLAAVGLGYLTLGQPLNTLSGGEAQRLKLVRYLGTFAADARATQPAPALLLLDEPTTGLHRHDVARLLTVLHDARRPGSQRRRDRAQSRRAEVRRLDHRGRSRRRRGRRPHRGGGSAGTVILPADSATAPFLRGGPRGRRSRRARRRGRGPGLLRARAVAPASVDRRAGEQPQGSLAHAAAPAAERRHRRVGVGQVHPRLRHRVRRGAAAVHGVDVALRPAVRRTAPASRHRPADRHPADGRDRATGHPRFAQVHRRDDHRGRPVPASPLRAPRRAASSRHGQTGAAALRRAS